MTGDFVAGEQHPDSATRAASDRVLFLDFDGVLHPTDAYGDGPVRLPIADMIPTHDLFRWTGDLADLLAHDRDVGIVVHSSWRHLYGDADLSSFLGPLGDRYAGAAPRGARHEGITAWIELHQPLTWLVLDDDADAFPDQTLPLVVCPPREGITAPAVRVALQHWLATTRPDGHAGDDDGDERRRRVEEERDRRVREYGCVFDPGDSHRDVPSRRAPLPTLVLGTTRPRRMRTTLGLEPSSWSTNDGTEHTPVLWGVCLPVRPDRLDELLELHTFPRLWDVKPPAGLSALAVYHHVLDECGLSCEHGYDVLEGGWFPIDVTCLPDIAALDRLATTDGHVLAVPGGDENPPAWLEIARAVWPDVEDALATRDSHPDWVADQAVYDSHTELLASFRLVFAVDPHTSGWRRPRPPQYGSHRAAGQQARPR